VSFALGWWVATHPEVQASVASPEQIRQLVEKDFENYYSESPAASFAAKVWTNNAWVAALSLASGILILPVFWGLWQNAVNVGVAGGLMAAGGKLDIFFGLITPHGLLELTAVFVAAGAGLRLGWCWISPGRRTRSEALAEEGRVAAGLAVGLVIVLFVSGVIEAFVTPSPLPTWARVGIGVVVEILFLLYVFVLGRRAALGGETGTSARPRRRTSRPPPPDARLPTAYVRRTALTRVALSAQRGGPPPRGASPGPPGSRRSSPTAACRARSTTRSSATPGFLETDDGALALGQPFSAATWYPVNDHPSDAAKYRIRITVPRAWRRSPTGSSGATSPRGPRVWTWPGRSRWPPT
jgi:uncharacterized membrane protein SpoIIM required for sporulation